MPTAARASFPLSTKDIQVAQHKRGDLGDDLRAPQPIQAEDQVTRRRGRGQQQRRQYAQRALREDVPAGVQPIDGQRQTEPVDRITLAENGSAKASKTNGSSIKARLPSQPAGTRATAATTASSAAQIPN